MLGRIRAPSSSLESLEEEREEPSKITKHDSLSIYEATLVKLRQGAQRDQTSITDQEMKIDEDPDSASDQLCKEVMVIDTYPSPSSVLSSPSEWTSCSSSRERIDKTTTVISMFKKYRASHCAQKTTDQTLTETDQILIDE